VEEPREGVPATRQGTSEVGFLRERLDKLGASPGEAGRREYTPISAAKAVLRIRRIGDEIG
jgi:hypothetical protein